MGEQGEQEWSKEGQFILCVFAYKEYAKYSNKGDSIFGILYEFDFFNSKYQKVKFKNIENRSSCIEALSLYGLSHDLL